MTLTASELRATLDAAKPGETVTLAGEVPALRWSKKAFAEPLTIDLTAATVIGAWYLTDVAGLVIVGGAWRVPTPASVAALRFDRGSNVTVEGGDFANTDEPNGYGVFLNSGSSIVLRDCAFSRYKSGIAANRLDGFEFVGNRFRQLRNDGMTIGESRRGYIAWNDFADTRPVTTAEHPDAIQLFSRPTSPPTADIVIEKNRVRSLNSQGLVGFDHVRAGVPDGGFDRITIQDNDVCVGFPHAIALVNARDSIVQRNRVTTFAGAKHRASINLTAGSVERTGNTVAAHGKTKGDDDPAPGDALAAQVADLTAKLEAVRAAVA